MPQHAFHTAHLFVDLTAICQNWRTLDSLTPRSCHTGAVIKANAYGLGMVPVSLALYKAGCRYFYTARLSEALALNAAFEKAAITKAKIIVFDGILAGQETYFHASNLIPVLNSFAQIDRAKQIAKNQDKPLPVIIHIDTAMARLGLSGDDWQQLRASDGWDAGLDIQMLISHLASSDDKDSAQNKDQLSQFQEAVAGMGLPVSLANSGGITLGEAFHFDLTRPGLALYGLSPDGKDDALKSAFTLTADILQIREVRKGTTIGYGATFTAPKKMRLATLGIGYADGLLRHYKDALVPRVCGYACPFVGRISMDSCVVDISAVPEALLPSAVSCLLLDQHMTAHDLAQKTGTIAYEIITTLGERVQRLYDDDQEGKSSDKTDTD